MLLIFLKTFKYLFQSHNCKEIMIAKSVEQKEKEISFIRWLLPKGTQEPDVELHLQLPNEW